jgi:serine/threonine protein kinase
MASQLFQVARRAAATLRQSFATRVLQDTGQPPGGSHKVGASPPGSCDGRGFVVTSVITTGVSFDYCLLVITIIISAAPSSQLTQPLSPLFKGSVRTPCAVKRLKSNFGREDMQVRARTTACVTFPAWFAAANFTFLFLPPLHVIVVLQEFSREADVMRKLKHTNIVRLCGYCSEGSRCYLVQELGRG